LISIIIRRFYRGKELKEEEEKETLGRVIASAFGWSFLAWDLLTRVFPATIEPLSAALSAAAEESLRLFSALAESPNQRAVALLDLCPSPPPLVPALSEPLGIDATALLGMVGRLGRPLPFDAACPCLGWRLSAALAVTLASVLTRAVLSRAVSSSASTSIDAMTILAAAAPSSSSSSALMIEEEDEQSDESAAVKRIGERLVLSGLGLRFGDAMKVQAELLRSGVRPGAAADHLGAVYLDLRRGLRLLWIAILRRHEDKRLQEQVVMQFCCILTPNHSFFDCVCFLEGVAR
jgi:hypothetical protein